MNQFNTYIKFKEQKYFKIIIVIEKQYLPLIIKIENTTRLY